MIICTHTSCALPVDELRMRLSEVDFASVNHRVRIAKSIRALFEEDIPYEESFRLIRRLTTVGINLDDLSDREIVIMSAIFWQDFSVGPERSMLQKAELGDMPLVEDEKEYLITETAAYVPEPVEDTKITELQVEDWIDSFYEAKR